MAWAALGARAAAAAWLASAPAEPRARTPDIRRHHRQRPKRRLCSQAFESLRNGPDVQNTVFLARCRTVRRPCSALAELPTRGVTCWASARTAGHHLAYKTMKALAIQISPGEHQPAEEARHGTPE